MKKTAFILLLLLAAWTAGAQNASRIRRDAAYLSAEGKAPALHAADSAALAGLAARMEVLRILVKSNAANIQPSPMRANTLA